jgi:hypothetical protein
MSFTRFHDDPCRIKKQMQESTGAGRYILNVPGNGDKPCFMDDPYYRLQLWGANLMTNTINLESDLMGLTRSQNRDCLGINDYKSQASKSKKVTYPVCLPTTEQPRATHPAWTARDLEQVNWSILPLDPQENVCIPFQNNLSTRILERDYFLAKAPCLNKGGSTILPTQPFGGYGQSPNNLCTTTAGCGNGLK